MRVANELFDIGWFLVKVKDLRIKRECEGFTHQGISSAADPATVVR